MVANQIRNFSRAITYSVLYKAIQILSQAITILFLANLTTPEMQGLFYVFWSLIGLQIFVEMGLGGVIQSYASHIWTTLTIKEGGQLSGEEEQLVKARELFVLGKIWFAIGGTILVIILIPVGLSLLSMADVSSDHYYLQWICASILAGTIISLQVYWSILEGFDQVEAYYRFRSVQALLGSAMLWLTIWLGYELWAIVVSLTIQFLVAIHFLIGRFGPVFGALFQLSKFKQPNGLLAREIFPFQWRVAVSFISGYFCFTVQTPLAMYFFGEETAGQIGMTWQLTGIVSTIAGAFVVPMGPRLAMAVKNAERKRVWQIFRLMHIVSAVVAVLLALGLLIGFSTVEYLGINALTKVKQSLASLEILMFFLLGQLCVVLMLPSGYYFRAHKDWPLTLLSLASAVCNVVISIILMKLYGIIGISVGFALSQIFALPMLFYIFKRRKKVYLHRRYV
jgi:O-antigen/teichoic acid export membrane protein